MKKVNSNEIGIKMIMQSFIQNPAQECHIEKTLVDCLWYITTLMTNKNLKSNHHKVAMLDLDFLKK